MTASPRFIGAAALSFSYNADDDVLYVRWGSSPALYSYEVGGHAMVRLTETDEPAGVTILDAKRRHRLNPAADMHAQAAALATAVVAAYTREKQASR